MTEPIVIGPLQPGTYVLELDHDIAEYEVHAIHSQLMEMAPDCRFIILAPGARLRRDDSEVTP